MHEAKCTHEGIGRRDFLLNFVLENGLGVFDNVPRSAPENAPGRPIFGSSNEFEKFTLPMLVIRNYVLEP
jgi:hypothetical protein